MPFGSESLRLPLLRNPWGKAVLLVAMGGAVLFVPYAVPVRTATVSLSYVVQYNNRIAQLIFIVSCCVFAWLTGGDLGQARSQSNRDIGVKTLFAGLCFVGFFSFLHAIQGLKQPEFESLYLLNRVQMFAAGYTPYRQFEFAYGPLLLWLPRVLAICMGHSILLGYFAAFIVANLLGLQCSGSVCDWLPTPSAGVI